MLLSEEKTSRIHVNANDDLLGLAYNTIMTMTDLPWINIVLCLDVLIAACHDCGKVCAESNARCDLRIRQGQAALSSSFLCFTVPTCYISWSSSSFSCTIFTDWLRSWNSFWGNLHFSGCSRSDLDNLYICIGETKLDMYAMRWRPTRRSSLCSLVQGPPQPETRYEEVQSLLGT